jgi:biotin carboxyl carrier protein
MVTSVALGLVISFEPHELDVMRRPPRAVARPILDGFAIWRVIFVGVALLVLTLGAFFWMKSMDAPDALARAVAVNTLVIGQIFYLLNSRFKTDSSLSLGAHLGNRYLPMGVAAVVVLQLLFTYAPPLQRLFGTQAVPLDVWPWLFLGGFVFFLVVEAEKFIIRAFGLARTATAPQAGPARQANSGTIAAPTGKWQVALGALAVAALIAGEIYVFTRAEPGEGLSAGETRGPTASVASLTKPAVPPPPTEVFAPVSGRVAAILCETGAAVQAGQICAKLDPAPFEEAVARAKAALAKAAQGRDASAAAVSKAKKEVERRQSRGASRGPALERARSALATAEARAEADEKAVAQGRDALAAAEAERARADIAAPVTGVVVSTAEVGATVEGEKGPAVLSIGATR